MNTELLQNTINDMISLSKGILAADESVNTMNKKLETYNIEANEENRMIWRDFLLSNKDIYKNYISSIILNKETLMNDNIMNNISSTVVIGAKVDDGIIHINDICMTKGLDTLDKVLPVFYARGVRFVKWRSTFVAQMNNSVMNSIHLNSHIFAYYSLIAHNNNLIPIIEPEVLADGTHSIDNCKEVTEYLLHHLYSTLKKYAVSIPYTILKINTITPGIKNFHEFHVDQIGQYTKDCFLKYVPKEVPLIVFLSGGHSSENINRYVSSTIHYKKEEQPWKISFSYGRAIQDSALEKFPYDKILSNDILYKNCKSAFDATQ